MDNFPMRNTGFLPDRKETDYLAGTLPYSVVLPSGDWRPYVPDGEMQRDADTDTMACVSHSFTNLAEIQLKQQGHSYNFSDRWLAKISGTTPTGNSFSNVAYAARKQGLVLESDYPAPESYDWDSYYQQIPAEVLTKALMPEISYEWLSTAKTELIKHLKQAPIQIAIPGTNPNHAVVLVAIEGDRYWYFDSYSPYLKSMTMAPALAFKVIIKDIPMNNEFIKIINHKGTIYFGVGAKDVNALKNLGEVFHKEVVVNADGTIEADIVVS